MVEHHPFKLNSEFEPQGDQPQAIKKIVEVLKLVNVIKHYLVQRVLVKHLP